MGAKVTETFCGRDSNERFIIEEHLVSFANDTLCSTLTHMSNSTSESTFFHVQEHAMR